MFLHASFSGSIRAAGMVSRSASCCDGPPPLPCGGRPCPCSQKHVALPGCTPVNMWQVMSRCSARMLECLRIFFLGSHGSSDKTRSSIPGPSSRPACWDNVRFARCNIRLRLVYRETRDTASRCNAPHGQGSLFAASSEYGGRELGGPNLTCAGFQDSIPCACFWRASMMVV